MIPRRLLFNRHWWYAHRDEFPTRVQWLTLILCMMVFFLLSYIFDAWRTKQLAEEHAAFITATQGLFKGCVEGRNALGSKIMEDGKEWEERCIVVMRRKGT